MNLSIFLTLLRIFFVPLLVVLLLTRGSNMDLWAVAVFLLAAATDLADGYVARRRGQITKLGILLDPVADKFLTSAAFISLVELHLVPAWMVVIIVSREFAVSGLRAIASAQGVVMQASELGKTKMVFQVAAITVMVLEPRYPALRLPGEGLLWLVVLFALVSAAQYFRNFCNRVQVSAPSSAPRPSVVLPVEGKQREENRVAAHRSR
jgi:CDP-diacylglycerol--glycerol-3-phosphate 3-phosphatidyltransferase